MCQLLQQHGKLFGDNYVNDIDIGCGIPLLAQLPIDPKVAAARDSCEIDNADLRCISVAQDKIMSL